MKKMIKKIVSTKIIICLSLLLGTTSCSLEPVWYSEVTPETFFTSRETVLAFKGRPFTHFNWTLYNNANTWLLQEVTTDAFVAPTRDDQHWADGGSFYRLNHHLWTADDGRMWTPWYGPNRLIAMTLEAQEILSTLDYEALGLTLTERASHLMQLQVLRAWAYLTLLDSHGGVPIFTSTAQRDVRRSTDRETFEHTEQLLLEAIPYLPRKTELGAREVGNINQAAAAALLARLYFNAISYIGEDRFADAARVSRRILDGAYGTYALGATWYCVHSFNNANSPEMIWNRPSEAGRWEFRWHVNNWYPVNFRFFFDIAGAPGMADGWNGWCLTPSRDLEGNLWPHRLGNPFETFHDLDVRKRQYRYLGDGRHEGMFIVGELTNPRTGDPVMGAQGMTGQPLTMVDFIGRPYPYPNGPIRSTLRDAQENQGIRLVKTPIPNIADVNLLWRAGAPVIRLAEIYFILAESEMRAGNLGRAAELINAVRARNFEGADPDPVTAANLDSYRMLDEWLIEFLGEGRRRTDLIRWDKFVTRPWWDFEPHNDRRRHRFPIPNQAISAAGGPEFLPQNPGY